jgi:hypothetical protein
MTVRAVSQIDKDLFYDKILPFSLAILENRVSVEEIRKLTQVPEDYYRALINESIRLYINPVPEVKSFLQQPIADLNKTLANQYFIGEINMLHESPSNIRFRVLNSLSARELYFLLIGGNGELYTSSFLYIYNKFLKQAGAEGLDNFFEEIGYYQFPQFIVNISGYGLVDDLVDHLREEVFARLIGNYFYTFQNTQLTDNQVILSAMTMSEVLYEVRHHQTVKLILESKLDSLEKKQEPPDLMLQGMYSGLRGILDDQFAYSNDSTYEVLTIKRLQKQNVIVQAHFFYDDEDAITSFMNSVASYDPAIWDKEETGDYIVFNSRLGNHMRVYMNKPMTRIGCDSAQDEMLHAIEQDGYEITSFIHRGHSYYLFQSLKKITASGQFVFLGSCGGYNEVLKIFQLNPDMNIITTRNIGSILINDPLLQKINLDIVNNKDIVWSEVWQYFNSRFQTKQTKDLFSSYIPPNKYIGIKFIRKVFNY